MITYKLDKNKVYKLTKVLEDDSLELKGIASPDWDVDIMVGYNIMLAGWITTPVQEIEILGKGVLVYTLNSTYLIEETESLNVDFKNKDQI